MQNKLYFLLLLVFLTACHRNIKKPRPLQSYSNIATYCFKESLVQNIGLGAKYHFVYSHKKWKFIEETNDYESTTYQTKAKEKLCSFCFGKGLEQEGKKIDLDSLALAKELLQNMPIGGATDWNYPELGRLIILDPKDAIYPPSHRCDLITYYYLYYGLFEQDRGHIEVLKVILEDSAKKRYPSSLSDTLLVGNPDELYAKLPDTKENQLLYVLHQCYKKWLIKVEKIGWQKAKQQGLSPFEDCSCRLVLVPPKPW
ncbi:MAG: hypothetical protein GY810_18665 [Aureispira sp.]|nr:hypothetical protein [Aureispira sp.]